MTDLHAGDRISLGELLRNAARGLPDGLTVQKGLWNLAMAKPDRKCSLGLMLEDRTQRWPQQLALKFGDRQWTYAEFNAWVNRTAALFQQAGVGSGDVVGILSENRPGVMVCAAAAVKLGAIAGMLNHNQRGEVLAHSIKLIQPKVIVVGEESVDTLATTAYGPGAQGIRHYCMGDGQDDAAARPAGYEDLARCSAGLPAANPASTRDVRMKQPAFYIFTSGTTGLPKASIMSHLRWVRSMAGVGQMAMRLRRQDVIYLSLPLYHNNALTVTWSAAIGAGCCVALTRKFSVTRFWDEVRHYEATAFCYIGELCRYLLNQPPSPRDREHRIRVIVGNGLRPEIWDEFQQRFGIKHIAEFYGASEGNLAFINAFGMNRTAGYCPLTYAVVEYDAEHEAPARDAQGRLRKVAKGGVGLLVSEVTDKLPFDGYTDPAASEKKLLRNSFKDGDCWFNTGDLVRDQGFRHIQFVDRVGDTFRWKGENVATTEVEAALTGFPQIEQAVVYGVELPGADGRAGMAALTLKADAGELDGAGLIQHLQSVLPAYAVPLFLRLRATQETTGTFKYRKVELKQEGFDPSKVSEPLYALSDRARGYETLSMVVFERIQRRDFRC
jgi:acyl-CoA synthetase (AMP-forming)/AMP-acid ligase II